MTQQINTTHPAKVLAHVFFPWLPHFRSNLELE
jgi:hypothetical protein